MSYTYPLVVCSVHRDHEPRPGWAVCIHVSKNCLIPIEHLRTPTRDQIGEILCYDCYQRYSLDRLILMCPECVGDLLRARDLHP